MREFCATANDDGQRLSRFVKRVTRALPDALMYKMFRAKRIKVNGKRAAADYRLRQSDVVQLYINDEFFAQDGAWWPQSNQPLPDFEVEHEGTDIAILFKPAGVLTHRDTKGNPGLLNAFVDALVQRGEYDPREENTFVPAVCNRLDRGTEGLVVVAKTAAALRGMNEVIRDGLLEKTYLCVCHGTPPEGVHHAFLQRNRVSKTVVVTAKEAAGAKDIATGVHILQQYQGLSLCEIQLLTGRTHQIRAHLAFLGSPLLGDKKYGTPFAGSPSLDAQALSAWRLTFAEALPPESSVFHLAGHRFTATHATLPHWWRQYSGQHI